MSRLPRPSFGLGHSALGSCQLPGPQPVLRRSSRPSDRYLSQHQPHPLECCPSVGDEVCVEASWVSMAASALCAPLTQRGSLDSMMGQACESRPRSHHPPLARLRASKHLVRSGASVGLREELPLLGTTGRAYLAHGCRRKPSASESYRSIISYKPRLSSLLTLDNTRKPRRIMRSRRLSSRLSSQTLSLPRLRINLSGDTCSCRQMSRIFASLSIFL